MYLAQMNLSEILYPTTDPRFIKFNAGARLINQKIQSAKGYICGEQIYDDKVTFITRSVWQSPEDLAAFIYAGTHARFIDLAPMWFKPSDAATAAFWFTEDATLPSLDEAYAKLERLHQGHTDVMGIEWLTSFKASSNLK